VTKETDKGVNEKEVKNMKAEKEVKGVTENKKEATKQKASKAERIRQLYLEGLNYYQISKKLGVRPQYARNVIVYAVESPSSYKEIKAEYERRQKVKQATTAEK